MRTVIKAQAMKLNENAVLEIMVNMKKRIFAAAVMILMISFSACSKQENQQSNIAKEDEKYSEILTYLNDSSYTDITQISRAAHNFHQSDGYGSGGKRCYLLRRNIGKDG